MAEDKKTFLQGKMNGDIDARLLPKGEYRSAQNIQISTSEDQDVGTVQNILGNSLIEHSYGTGISYSHVDTIGCFFDEKNNKVFYFVTNYTCENTNEQGLVGDEDGPKTAEQQSAEGITILNPEDLFCGVFVYDKTLNSCKLIVSGLFLNFSKTHEINGVNILEKLLFWTDGLNQPRKINIDRALDDTSYYNTEEKISVAKFAPFMPPLLLDFNTTTLNSNSPTVSEPTQSLQSSSSNSFPDNQIKEKFVRFSYRFKFKDGEYSTIAPFTQICFIPKTTSYDITQTQEIFKKGKVSFQDNNGDPEGMVNDVNAVNLNIILPSKNINTDFEVDGIEIIYKESDNNLLRAVELVEIKDSDSENGVFQYRYKSTLPYKTLPQDQTTRIYDNVPLSAKAQEAVGNRIIYGNFVQDRALPNQNSGAAGLDFQVGVEAKYDITNPLGNADFNNYYLHKEYPFHSIKEKRTYEVGVVLSDKFGRQSPVLTSIKGLSSIKVDNKSSGFHASSWDTAGVISNTSPGNENYCGDALNITFNNAIPNAYGKATLIENVAFNADGSILYNVNVESALIQDDNLGLVGKLTVQGNNIQGSLQVGDYLKGDSKDFVKVLSVTFGSNTIVLADGLISKSYKSTTTNPDGVTEVPKLFANYRFYKYSINTYGWYSYRIVVKQTEQEYYNVYAPNIINFDNDQDEDKSYIPILGDNINKVTRDKEFTNTQEVGLSTSKARLYPKIIPSETDGASSVQSFKEDLDVISIGTAKEQGLTNENNDVFGFISSFDKNPLLAEIPYGNSSLEIGAETTTGIAGTEKTLIASDVTAFTAGGKVLNIPSASDAGGTAGLFTLGSYLKGEDKDLVKIIKITQANPCLIECDNSISDIYKNLVNGQVFKIYDYKYGIQDRLSVLETMPFKSALDIYYETSTAGLVHELNEAVLIEGSVDSIIDSTKNFSEGTLFYDDAGNFTNNFVSTLQVLDQNDNQITAGSGDNQISLTGMEITNCIGTNWGGDDIDATSDFSIEYVADTNDFKIKPKQGKNFVYNYFEAPTKYTFTIKITLNSGTEFEKQLTVDLINEEPIVNSSNQPGVFETDTSNVSSAFDVVIHSIEATNGSTEGSSSGLRYYSNNFNPNEFDVPIEIGNITTKHQFLVHDTEGNIVPELTINNFTGAIILNDNYNGYLNKNIVINIADSLDWGVEDSQGTYGGKFVSHDLKIQASANFIVIEKNKFTENTGSVINGFDIFDQSGLPAFNFYWTQSPTSDQIEKMNGLSSIADGAGIFLCSGNIPELEGLVVKENFTAWGLKKDTDGAPLVVPYFKEDAITVSFAADSFIPNLLAVSELISYLNNRSRKSYYNVKHQDIGTGNNPLYDYQTELTDSHTGVISFRNHWNSASPQGWLPTTYGTDARINARLITNAIEEAWDPNEYGNIQTGLGVAAGNITGSIDNSTLGVDGYSDDFYKGSFAAYRSDGTIIGRVSPPILRSINTSGNLKNEIPSAISSGFPYGDPTISTSETDKLWMCLANELFEDGNGVEYNVLYDVNHREMRNDVHRTGGVSPQFRWYNYMGAFLERVMLCRKKP